MSLTTDPKDPRLGKWGGKPEDKPTPQDDVYLVLSDEERAKGFVRPYRDAYRHVGLPGPKYPLRDLTDQERERFKTGDGRGNPYVKFEVYPKELEPLTGKCWTQKQLDSVGQGCGTVTTMGRALSETYARDPHFYGATYCYNCMRHFAVGKDGEFVWEGTDERVGT
ncbi:MAG: hypothetical protein EPO20_14730 [Betaproteobacteria bacterium]|nr:MAG: hypothetical protein EPO20_14730 [Betaproteobacteria bacterium]